MDDLISRQAAINAIQRALDRETLLNSLVRKIAVDAIRLLPAADVRENVKGEWIPCNVQEILDYLDAELHPIVSPEHWDVYSNLHDMISNLLY